MSQDESDRDICKPIKNVTDLYNYMENPPYWGQLVIPLSKRSKVVKNADLYHDGYVCHFAKNKHKIPARFEYGSVPKTLVCHDMKNGYHDDSYVNGTDNYAAYSFYHWAAIDMFVYFSHHFISIPPLGWINVAHKHGVKILGTLITEWQDGFKICEEILQSESEMQKFVQQLVTITKYFKIDGWLLNIENKVDKVDMLLKFVEYLTLKMHHENPQSVVIWYDSVTKTGALQWQNCLNHLNKDFFNACDGIFTNYCWSPKDLQSCVEEAGSRRHDVFVGVDVWGRNFWGGGGFNTTEAVKEIHKFDLSMAIFAPAWTHEGIQFSQLMGQQYKTENIDNTTSCSTKSLDLTETHQIQAKSHYFLKCAVREHFILRESALWNSLWPYLNSMGPSQLPFQTFFCFGSGEKKWMDGEIINEELWFNLREQQYQLSTPVCSNSYFFELVIEPPKPKSSTDMSKEAENDNQSRNKRENDELSDGAHKDNIKVSQNLEVTGQAIQIPSLDPALLNDIFTQANEEKTSQVTSNEIAQVNLGMGECDIHKTPNSTCSKCSVPKIQEEQNVVKKNVTSSELGSPAKEKKVPVKKFNVKPDLGNVNCLSFHNEDSFNGGGCIKISPVIPESSAHHAEKVMIRLLLCEFLCDHNFIVYYAIKKMNVHDDQDLNLLISLKHNNSGKISNIVLSEKISKNTMNESGDIILNSVNEKNQEMFKKLQENLLSNHSGFYIPVSNENEWKIRYFCLEFPNSTILEINCELTERIGSIILGGLGVAKDVVLF